MPSERQPTLHERRAEVASLLAGGMLRLKPCPKNGQEKPPIHGVSVVVPRESCRWMRRTSLTMAPGAGGENGLYSFSVAVQSKLEEIGEDQVGEGRAIANELPRILDGIQSLLRGVLGLDVADDAILAVPEAKIGVAGIRGLRKRGQANVRSPCRIGYCLQHFCECGIETFLARIPLLGLGMQFLKVCFEQCLVAHVIVIYSSPT